MGYIPGYDGTSGRDDDGRCTMGSGFGYGRARVTVRRVGDGYGGYGVRRRVSSTTTGVTGYGVTSGTASGVRANTARRRHGVTSRRAHERTTIQIQAVNVTVRSMYDDVRRAVQVYDGRHDGRRYGRYVVGRLRAGDCTGQHGTMLTAPIG